MLHEFALVPDVFDVPGQGNWVKSFLRLLAETAVMADLNKDGWSKHMLDPTSTPLRVLEPQTHKDITLLLQTLKSRNRLVRHPKRTDGPPGSAQDWLDLGIDANNRQPLAGIFHGPSSTHPEPPPDLFLGLPENFLSGSACEACVQRNRQIVKAKVEVIRVLEPFLRHARDVRLVDPYLIPNDRYFEMIDLVTSVSGFGGSGPNGKTIALQLHTSIKPQQDDFQIQRDSRISAGIYGQDEEIWHDLVNRRIADWDNFLRGRIPNVPKFDVWVYIWGFNTAGRLFHNRGIFTDQAAISFESGLALFPLGAAETDTCNLLDYNVRVNRAMEFDEAASPYKLLAKKKLDIS